ncbi:MAG: Ig-like domain-containing protein, partial [Prevotella sp.]|nr:Ig-like domain-containing protein [Prevotella sp.]
GIALFTYENYCYSNAGIVTTLELEYTGATYNLDDYDFVADAENFTYSFDEDDPTEITDSGKYTLTLTVCKTQAIILKEKEYSVYVTVKDTTAPVFKVDSPATITVTRDCKLKKLIKYFPVSDTDDVKLYIDADSYDLSTVGRYNTEVVAIDADGNTSYLDVIINVISPKITINESDCTLYIGQTLKLTPHVTGRDKTVTWKSANEDIATVDADGNVTGVSGGSTKITVSANGVENSIACFVVGSPDREKNTEDDS